MLNISYDEDTKKLSIEGSVGGVEAQDVIDAIEADVELDIDLNDVPADELKDALEAVADKIGDAVAEEDDRLHEEEGD